MLRAGERPPSKGIQQVQAAPRAAHSSATRQAATEPHFLGCPDFNICTYTGKSGAVRALTRLVERAGEHVQAVLLLHELRGHAVEEAARLLVVRRAVLGQVL